MQDTIAMEMVFFFNGTMRRWDDAQCGCRIGKRALRYLLRFNGYYWNAICIFS
jgi:hypothetical protein